MDEHDIAEIEAKITWAAQHIHAFGLVGSKINMNWRLLGESIDIKWGNKEEAKMEKTLKKQGKAIVEHEVENAITEEKQILEYFLKAAVHMYKGSYNPLMAYRYEIDNINTFLSRIHKSKKLDDETKKKIAQGVDKAIDALSDDLETLRKKLNGLWSKAKGGVDVGLAMTKLFHTTGAGFIRRSKEWHLFKDGHKDACKAAADEDKILKRHFKTQQEADAIIANLEDHLKRSEAEYAQATSLLFLEWQEIEQYLQQEGVVVQKAADARELPQMEPKQFNRLAGLILEKVTEPQLHNLQNAIVYLHNKSAQLSGRKVKKIAA